MLILHGGRESDRQDEAVTLARAFLCGRTAAERPCGECTHCRRIVWPKGGADVFHPDFGVLTRDLKTVTSVDATKEFLRPAQVSPFEARGQVFVIANAETLSGEAANALLKTLEEPPTSAPRHFMLLAPSQLELLPTLRSRSLSLFLGTPPRPRDEEIDAHAREFARAIDSYRGSANGAELLVAAGVLKGAGSFKDPRDSGVWERSAAIVIEAAEMIEGESAPRRAMLDLAADLLEGPGMRVRGIQPERILEGLVFRRLE